MSHMEESTISKDIVRNKNIVSVIAVLMLLLAIPSGNMALWILHSFALGCYGNSPIYIMGGS